MTHFPLHLEDSWKILPVFIIYFYLTHKCISLQTSSSRCWGFQYLFGDARLNSATGNSDRHLSNTVSQNEYCTEYQTKLILSEILISDLQMKKKKNLFLSPFLSFSVWKNTNLITIFLATVFPYIIGLTECSWPQCMVLEPWCLACALAFVIVTNEYVQFLEILSRCERKVVTVAKKCIPLWAGQAVICVHVKHKKWS